MTVTTHSHAFFLLAIKMPIWSHKGKIFHAPVVERAGYNAQLLLEAVN